MVVLLAVAAISSIKEVHRIKREWNFDPCVPKEFIWNGVSCTSNSIPRITAMSVCFSFLFLSQIVSIYTRIYVPNICLHILFWNYEELHLVQLLNYFYFFFSETYLLVDWQVHWVITLEILVPLCHCKILQPKIKYPHFFVYPWNLIILHIGSHLYYFQNFNIVIRITSMLN